MAMMASLLVLGLLLESRLAPTVTGSASRSRLACSWGPRDAAAVTPALVRRLMEPKLASPWLAARSGSLSAQLLAGRFRSSDQSS